MKEIVVISGKGGTGKTSLVGSFAALAKNKIMVDCDVDAADLHLLLKPTVIEKQEFRSGQRAFIYPDKCIQCGLCQSLCRFAAIRNYRVENISCEGCGFCEKVCPVQAINMRENLAGDWFISYTRYGLLVHARLGIAQENSGKLVATIRKQAQKIAEENHLDYIISDGPPGIGCPVISSLSGVDLALLVTEPTLSGIHDLERIYSVCQHFNVPVLVCVNKYDINLGNTRQIEKYCFKQGIDLAAQISFDNIVTEAMVDAKPVVEYTHHKVAAQIEVLWENMVKALKK